MFYSYRGATEDNTDRDRQIENNLTKALVNTLSLGREPVWRRFLANIGLPDATDAKFLLQRRDLPSGGARKKRDRVLLGISKATSDWAPGPSPELPYPSIPDAWIYGDGFAVLVESKVSGDFSSEQMNAHLACLGTQGGPPRVVKKTWAEIHSFFRALLPTVADDSREGLLIWQFVQFLEYSAMAGFTGFRRDHFDYFLLHDDEDARLWIKEQMESFAARLLSQLQSFAAFYEAFEVGVLRQSDSSCWVAFGPRPSGYRNVTHQTISLRSDGLRAFVNTELKAATDRLRNALQHRGTELRRTLQHLHQIGPFQLILEERTQRQASLYDYTPKMQLHSSMLIESAGDVAWNAFVETLRRLPLPYVRIERRIPAAELIDLSQRGEEIQFVEQILEQNHAIVDLMNGPSPVLPASP